MHSESTPHACVGAHGRARVRVGAWAGVRGRNPVFVDIYAENWHFAFKSLLMLCAWVSVKGKYFTWV